MIDINKPLELEDGTPCRLLEYLPLDKNNDKACLQVLILADVSHRLGQTETEAKGKQNWWFYDLDGHWSGDIRGDQRGKKMLRNVEEKR